MEISLGQKIREIRINKGLNMDDFGKLIDGANKSLVSKWENDKSAPGIARLNLIAKLGEISVEQLLRAPKVNVNLSEIREISDKLLDSCSYLDRLESLDFSLRNSSSDNNEYENISKAFSSTINALNIYEFKKSIIRAQKIIEEFTLRNNVPKIDTSKIDTKYKQQFLFPTFGNLESTEEENVNIELGTSINGELEEIFSINSNLSLNNRLLSIEEKQRALQILKLIFIN